MNSLLFEHFSCFVLKIGVFSLKGFDFFLYFEKKVFLKSLKKFDSMQNAVFFPPKNLEKVSNFMLEHVDLPIFPSKGVV